MPLKGSFRIWVRLLLVSSVFLAGCTLASPQAEKQYAEIVGEVVIQIPKGAQFPEIAGRTLPEDDFPVYLFTWEESGSIRQWLEKLENDMKAIKEDPGDYEKVWIAQKRAEDIYRMIHPGGASRSTKTDEKGRFIFKDLKVGEKYLVIAADLVHETGIVLTPQVVGPLLPGKNKVRLVNKN